MKLAIPLTPPPLDEAFDFVQILRRRLESGLVMTDRQWEQAVTAAVTRSDRAGLATLLQVHLVPALTRATLALGDAVRCALAPIKPSPPAYRMALATHIETTQRAVSRATKATWAGEHREGLLSGHARPSSAPEDWGRRVWATMSTYMHMEMAGDDVPRAIAEQLGLALRMLTGPARAAVECVDEGRLDDLCAYPLQQALDGASRALAGVRLYLLSAHMAEAEFARMNSTGPV